MSDQHTHTVTIYGSATCTYCDTAKAYCVRRGIPFTYHDIDEDFDAFDALHAKIGQWKTVPQIFVGERHAGGCDDFIAEYAKVEVNADEDQDCPICRKLMWPHEKRAFDVTEGECHAACLEGSAPADAEEYAQEGTA